MGGRKLAEVAGEFPGKVAGGETTRIMFDQERTELPADWSSVDTARMEVTARRRRKGGGDFPLQEDPFMLTTGDGAGDGLQ